MVKVQSLESYTRRAHKELLREGYADDSRTAELAQAIAVTRRGLNLRRKERAETIEEEGGSMCSECEVMASWSYPCPCRGRC